MPSFSEWLFGSPDKLKKVPTGTKEQQAFHSSILGQLMNMQGSGYGQAMNYLQDLLSPGGFEKFSEPYMQQFQSQVAPRLAEQYAGAGALSSSGFGQALGGAGANLESQLAQLYSGLQGQAAQGIMGQYNTLANLGLNYQPFAYQQKQGSQGILGPLAMGLGAGLGGPLGGALAGGISSLFKQPQGGGMGGMGGLAPFAAMMGR